MIALAENIIESYSALTMTNEDANYPVENIFSTIGTLYTKTTAGGTVITITFTSDQSADMFCLAFSSMTSTSTISCVYKNAGGATILTDSLTMGTHYIKKSYFTKLTTIRSIILTITNAAAIAFYIGTIWIGEKIQLPNFQAKPLFGFSGFAGFQKSKNANVTGQVKGTVKRWELNIPIIESETILDTIENYFDTINNLPHFIDFYEDIITNDKIYWCHYTMDGATPIKQNDNNFRFRDIKLIIEECN